MAKELQGNAGPTNTGLTTYFVVWDATGQVRSGGTTFAVASAANRNAGIILATELGTASGVYAADCPAFAAGVYSYAIYKRIGASAAETDTLLAGPGELEWDGAAVVPLSSRFPTENYNSPLNAADTRDAVGLAVANLDTQLSNIPTNTEFASAVALLATNAQLVKVLAAVYNSATAVGNVLTLSNGATQTINLTTGARTTVG